MKKITLALTVLLSLGLRSEERRVGKECGFWGWTYPYNEK